MGVKTLRALVLCSLLVVSPIGLVPFPSPEPADAEIVVERLKRVSRKEVHLWLKVTNRSEQPVFTGGYDLGQGPVLMLVFIEQRRAKEGWTMISCIDMPPPNVIKLNPGETITRVLWWKVPMLGVCKNRITRFEGKFRFRLEYFDSEKQVRTYIDNQFGGTGEEVKPRIAMSEAFEIPPTPNPED